MTRVSEALNGYEAYIKASNTDAGEWFGSNLALSTDASTFVVRGYHESSAEMGINDNNNQSDNSKPSSGAVYIIY